MNGPMSADSGDYDEDYIPPSARMGRTQRKAGNQMLSHLVPQGDQMVLGEALTKEADKVRYEEEHSSVIAA